MSERKQAGPDATSWLTDLAILGVAVMMSVMVRLCGDVAWPASGAELTPRWHASRLPLARVMVLLWAKPLSRPIDFFCRATLSNVEPCMDCRWEAENTIDEQAGSSGPLWKAWRMSIMPYMFRCSQSIMNCHRLRLT